MNVIRNIMIFVIVIFFAAVAVFFFHKHASSDQVSGFLQASQTTLGILFAAVTALLYKLQDVHHVKGYRKKETAELQGVVDRKVQRLWLHALCILMPMLLCHLPSEVVSKAFYETSQFLALFLLVVGILYVPFLPLAWSGLRKFQAEQKRFEEEQVIMREYVSRIEKDGQSVDKGSDGLVDPSKTHYL